MADRFHRRSIRLRGYDYTRAGAYYVTVCTQGRLSLFGDVVNDVMVPNAMGNIVQRCWDAIPEHMPMVVCDAFVVMPNHVHGIVVIRERHRGRDPVGADHDRPNTMPGFVRANDDRPPTTPSTVTTDASNDGPTDPTANAPRAPIRADHDRPLRPPADPGARPPTSMPIVPVGSLGRIVRAFKSAVTRAAYNDGLLPRGTPVWQRNYYERIIRDTAEHDRIAQYIAENPANWGKDRFNR